MKVPGWLVAGVMLFNVGLLGVIVRDRARSATARTADPPIEEATAPIPTIAATPAKVVSAGRLGCAAVEVRVSQVAAGRPGETSWVATCRGEAVACSSVEDAEGRIRGVTCSPRRK